MVVCEIGFRCRPDRGAKRRGDILVCRPVGMRLTGTEAETLILSGTGPAGFSALTQAVQDSFMTRAYHLRTLGDPDDGLALTGAQAAFPLASLEEQLYLIENARADRAKWILQGVDTSWGYEDQKTVGIITADVADLRALVQQDAGLRTKFVDFENNAAFTAQQRADWSDLTKAVRPSRAVTHAEIDVVETRA